MNRRFRFQNEFHGLIQRYVNGALISRRELLLGCLNYRIPIRLNAQRVIDFYREMIEQVAIANSPSLEVKVDSYAGTANEVYEVAEEVAGVHEHLILACVFGSIGSNDIVSYSDFDALVILGHSAFEDPSTLIDVTEALTRCQRHMIRFDPLQHHGWMVLTEYDLANFCDAYLPVEIFDEAKAIFPPDGATMRIVQRDSNIERIISFVQLKTSFQGVGLGYLNQSIFRVKKFLSQVMLLPSLYLQSLTGKGVSKKDSFELIREHFNRRDLKPIEQASSIRNVWEQEKGLAFSRVFSTNPALMKLSNLYHRRAPDEQLLRRIADFDFQGLAKLTSAMERRLRENESWSEYPPAI